MKLIPVAMLGLGALCAISPAGNPSAQSVTAVAATKAENELQDARNAYEQSGERSVDYDRITMRYKMAAVRAFRAEAEYQKFLVQSSRGL